MTHGRDDVEAVLGYALPDRTWRALVELRYDEDLAVGAATPEYVADFVREIRAPSERRLAASDAETQLIPGAEQLRAPLPGDRSMGGQSGP